MHTYTYNSHTNQKERRRKNEQLMRFKVIKKIKRFVIAKILLEMNWLWKGTFSITDVNIEYIYIYTKVFI